MSIWGHDYTPLHITQIKKSNLGNNCMSLLQSSCLNKKALAYNSSTITLRRKLHGSFYSCSVLTLPHALHQIIFILFPKVPVIICSKPLYFNHKIDLCVLFLKICKRFFCNYIMIAIIRQLID